MRKKKVFIVNINFNNLENNILKYDYRVPNTWASLETTSVAEAHLPEGQFTFEKQTF
jgi:hypothetical protein